MPQSFFISVKALIKRDRKILFLTKEIQGKTYWDLPGGRVEDMNSFEDTLTRELQEEIPGIGNIKILHQIAPCWELPSSFVKPGNRLLVLYYLVEVGKNDFKISAEHSSSVWIGSDNLNDILQDKKIIMMPGYEVALKLALVD
jgi:8-oxo-dGTP pyrophosphatase MutT (NUDIX family)